MTSTPIFHKRGEQWVSVDEPDLKSKCSMLLQKFCVAGGRKKATHPEYTKKTKNISSSFSEHQWDIDQLIKNHPRSRIDPIDPVQSQGLTTTDVNRLLEINGPNVLASAKEISDLALFAKQFLNLLWLLLLVASTLSFIGWATDPSKLYYLYVTICMFAMIFIMCTVSWWQERTARRAVKGFANLLPKFCQVVRDGKASFIPVGNLTIGDIIIIRTGDRVPADCRILKCNEFKLESSSITGEAEPLDYQSDAVAYFVTVFEARNVAFNGSLCVDGYGIAVVVRVGVNTVIGQISSMVTDQDDEGSELEIEIGRFIKFLIVMACSAGTTCFIVGGFVHRWKNVVSLLANGFLVCAIGMVPCGCPASVTSILTLVSRRMAKKNVYVKRLDVLEALGAVNIIASDKTGTLTKNIMHVTDIWTYDQIIEGVPEKMTMNRPGHGRTYCLQRLITILSVCNTAQFEDMERLFLDGMVGSKPRAASGSPSEVAMIQWCDRLIDISVLRDAHKLVFEIPFNSKRKWHLQIHKEHELAQGLAQYRIMMKGAPEILVQRCSKIYAEEGLVKLDKTRMAAFQKAYDGFGGEGKRVIGCIEATFTALSGLEFTAKEENYPRTEFIFVGMCAMMDPPREETAGAIYACKEAGIKIYMVTGDHPSTAAAIAVQIGLLTDAQKSHCVIHGDRIAVMIDEEWNSLLYNKCLVFARASPEQKLMIVEQCQLRGQSICMTGDGVNDAPALKKANVGIAMGSGSEVAKQAANIILMDNNFSSVVKAIEEGRTMFDNVKKLLGYTMPHCFPEVYSVLLYYILGMPQGITPLQVLSIDLGTELLPGISMSSEPAESNIMKEPPRDKTKKLVSNTLLAYGYLYTGQVQSLACFLSYLYVYCSYGIRPSDLLYSQDTWRVTGKTFVSNNITLTWEQQDYISRQACSAWHIGIVFGQWWHLWCARTCRESIFTHGLFANKLSLIGAVSEISLLCVFTYMPVLNTWLGGAPPPKECWFIVAGIGLFTLVFNETRKWCIRRWPQNSIVRVFKW